MVSLNCIITLKLILLMDDFISFCVSWLSGSSEERNYCERADFAEPEPSGESMDEPEGSGSRATRERADNESYRAPFPG